MVQKHGCLYCLYGCVYHILTTVVHFIIFSQRFVVNLQKKTIPTHTFAIESRGFTTKNHFLFNPELDDHELCLGTR